VWLYWDTTTKKTSAENGDHSPPGQWILREIVDPTQLKFKGQVTEEVFDATQDGFRGKTFFQWDSKKVPAFGEELSGEDKYKEPQSGTSSSAREKQKKGPTFNVRYLSSDLQVRYIV
jgi:hypothetical protein